MKYFNCDADGGMPMRRRVGTMNTIRGEDSKMTHFLIAFWRRLWSDSDGVVSGATVRHYARAEGRAGWDGPRWDLERGRQSFDEGWRS